MVDDSTPVTETRPTFKVWLKSVSYGIGNFFIRYPLATAATVLLVFGAVIMTAFGQKFQIGGLIGRLWGKSNSRDLPDAPVVIPPVGRVDGGGAIDPGQSDSKGYAQAPVVLPIKPPSILSDPTTVVVTHPDGKDVTIPLPTGVKNSDVKEVIMVSQNVYQIANNDGGIDAGKLLGDLDK